MSTRAVVYFSLGLFLLVALATALLNGCSPADRSMARAAVVTTSEAIHAADVTCARLVTSKGEAGRELAEKCVRAYDAARLAMILSASEVDNWEAFSTARENVTCAVVHALAYIEDFAKAISEAGGKVPPIIDDARSLVHSLGACKEITP